VGKIARIREISIIFSLERDMMDFLATRDHCRNFWNLWKVARKLFEIVGQEKVYYLFCVYFTLYIIRFGI
jgi:hypothetical protein